MAVSGMKNVDRVQVGRGDIGPAHARSLENDEQSGENSDGAHGKTWLPEHWQPAEPVVLSFARAESLIENFGDERGRSRFRLKGAKAADDMGDLREKGSALRAGVDMSAELTLLGVGEKTVEVVAQPFLDLYAGPGHFLTRSFASFLLVILARHVSLGSQAHFLKHAGQFDAAAVDSGFYRAFRDG